MLHDFLQKNGKTILAMTEKKTLELSENGQSSARLKQGLPIFYKQLLDVLRWNSAIRKDRETNKGGMAQAARDADEPAMSAASDHPGEVALATSAGYHGIEFLRLGYTLSHVVHAYGAMCQSITELAAEKNAAFTATEFHNLNRCLDVAIAGAVTQYESRRRIKESSREVEHLGFLAHELRNAVNSITIAYQLVKNGTVTPGGSTGQLVERGLKRIEELIDRSLTEVRLRVEPKVFVESGYLFQLVDQIVLTAAVNARERKQTLEIQIDPTLVIEGDQQLLHSSISNLIQNALKYTHTGGKIQVRGKLEGTHIVIEVEDECGGLLSNAGTELFKPFVQQHENREGLGLGLTIARRGIELNHGTIKARNIPGKGCVFTITLPKLAQKNWKHTASLEHSKTAH